MDEIIPNLIDKYNLSKWQIRDLISAMIVIIHYNHTVKDSEYWVRLSPDKNVREAKSNRTICSKWSPRHSPIWRLSQRSCLEKLKQTHKYPWRRLVRSWSTIKRWRTNWHHHKFIGNIGKKLQFYQIHFTKKEGQVLGALITQSKKDKDTIENRTFKIRNLDATFNEARQAFIWWKVVGKRCKQFYKDIYTIFDHKGN